MRVTGIRGRGDGNRDAAVLSHPKQGPHDVRREDDHAVPVPGASARRWRIAEGLGGAAGHGNLLELALREEPEMFLVWRPERQIPVVSTRGSVARRANRAAGSRGASAPPSVLVKTSRRPLGESAKFAVCGSGTLKRPDSGVGADSRQCRTAGTASAVAASTARPKAAQASRARGAAGLAETVADGASVSNAPSSARRTSPIACAR